ncbi:MAG: tetratricopeptide repeat protein [Bacteroidota bacterium]
MKKIIILFGLFISTQTVFSQDSAIDTLLKTIAAEKDETARVERILHFFAATQETDPAADMQNAQRLLQQSQKNKDRISEAMAFSLMGYDYWSFGNTIKHLEFTLKALSIAEETGNNALIASVKNNIGHYYNYSPQPDYHKALQLYLSAEENAAKAKSYKIQSWALMNLGVLYYSINKIDSALIYSQRAYELCMRIGYKDYLGYILTQLGGVQVKMGNPTLAVSYYDLAIKEASAIKSPRFVNVACEALSRYYYDNNQIDSGIYYAKRAIAAVQNTAFTNWSIGPAKLLLGIYKKINSDSALKYSEIFRLANDSLYSAKIIQQTQLLTFEEDIRQQELAAEKIKIEERRKQNIQYALIALGIITFVLFFLLLSRSFIGNAKVIEFFGVIALLIVFEFLNLLLHPFLEHITHHSPVLMLLALVAIAALLVPLHHYLQKMITHKLVEKNKQIRLASAKKTIAKLEKGG